MNWYEIEYSGGKASDRILGTYDGDLFLLLTSENAPKFIEIKNMAYLSGLSKKYELFDSWDSKWTNEALVSVENIISVRKIREGILGQESIGEYKIRSKNTGLLIIISKASADKYPKMEEVFRPKLDHLLKSKGRNLAYLGNYKYTEQVLLDEGEVIVKSFGNEIFNTKVEGDYVEGVLGEVDKWLTEQYSDSHEDED